MPITGTVKPLKDKQGNYIFPETGAEAVYYKDGRNMETVVTDVLNAVSNNNIALANKQDANDDSLRTSSKTISGAINELCVRSENLVNDIKLVSSYVPELGPGLAIFDDTVDNLMTVTKEGLVTYNFCVTGGKSNNNISNGATLCYIPAGVPVNRICYGVVNTETSSGLRKIAMSIVNPTTRTILLYFTEGDLTAVSSAKGTITWYVPTP